MLVPIFRFLSIFPLPVLHAMGATLGWVIYLLAPSYRRRMRQNMALAGYTQYLPAAIAEAGKAALELPFLWCADPRRVSRHASQKVNWPLVQDALASGRGIVFLTPHLGCFEICAQEVALLTELMVMYRPPKQEALKPLVEGARARGNLFLAPANMSGVRMLAKFLKRGKPIGLLPDQVPQEGEGVWAKWYGRDAYTMTLPAKLAKLGNPHLIVTYAERLPWGRGYRIHFIEITDPLEGDIAQQAQTINNAMQRLIAEKPSQYYWSYNRYKVPAGVAAPAAVGEQA
ncbi:lysophospholipid acyltransferase family protein [Duganella callida]|uniref:Lysophospholipid acyltransferase family protein n=1 Tax=Duganella callida TaxID=2561932 RepID=A0A4Y9T0Y1_9BURK|nr:lysophospholipid acyltransferase family protein [Duganella callida]TFW30656.1 lysophospholipid acyltransferase family protein [Duganella callida]